MKVLQTKLGGMMFGVIDSDRKGSKFVHWYEPNVISFSANNGEWMKNVGKKIGCGDNIRVKVNLDRGDIEWEVNGLLIRSHTSLQKLKNKDIRWVPFLQMKEGDIIEWLE